jgi:phage terminase large subunit-like protein
MCEVYRGSIFVPATLSTYKVLSKEVATKHGPNIHGLSFDEFHAQRTRDLFEALQRGMVKRRQPLLIMITTAGDDDETICFEEWEYARRVQSGTIADDIYLPVIFEIRKDEDWQSPKVWARLNPGLGITVKRDAIETECLAARNEPRKLNDFLRYHTNKWTNTAIAWFPIDWWDANTEEPEYEKGLLVGCGLDMAQKVDLAAFSVVVRHPRPDALDVEYSEEGDGPEPLKQTLALNFSVSLFVFFWMPEETMKEREDQDQVPYSEWRRLGFVRATPGALINEDRILRDIKREIIPRFGLNRRRCGYDPAFLSSTTIDELGKAGLQMVETPQNYQHMNAAAQAFYGLVKARWIRHGCARMSHPLRQHAENVSIKQDDAGRIRLVKPKNRKRIDGIVASVMGLDQLLREPAPQTSLYLHSEPYVIDLDGEDDEQVQTSAEELSAEELHRRFNAEDEEDFE